jgi:hypothetical protein
MSWSVLKFELLSKLNPPHASVTLQANVISQAYTNLVLRTFETLTGGGQFVGAPARTKIARLGMQCVFEVNRRYGKLPVNIFSQLTPYFLSYWAGQTCVGPFGQVTVIFPGVFVGPPIPPNISRDAFVNIMCGVLSTHMLTMTGIYTNFVTGVTIPWSGALLLTCR